MESEIKVYQYSALLSQPENSTGLFTTRLLHLLPFADRTAVLRCHLMETEIPDYVSKPSKIRENSPGRRVEFHALSYTWGVPIFPETLEVVQQTAEGESSSTSIIKIIESLHSALQNLRSPDKTLVLWVDAVCINQADISE